MYKKNTTGQFFCFQGVDALTGGIKAGVTWTVRRCIDGTFGDATGTATEDGTTGWYKFAMSQADTNGNNIGFNFTGTGAVPQTINIITDGAPPDVNVAQISGDATAANNEESFFDGTGYAGTNNVIPTVTGVTNAVVLPTGTGAGQIALSSGAVTVGTNNDKTGYALTVAPLDAAGVRTAVGLASANLDTQLDGLPTAAEIKTAIEAAGSHLALIKAKTDPLTFTVANQVDVNIQSVNDVAITGDGNATPWGPA